MRKPIVLAKPHILSNRMRPQGLLSHLEQRWFFAFISPWLLGFIAFTGGPIVAALYLSFTNYTATNTPTWVGGLNYSLLVTDPVFRQSISVTLYYTALVVPISLVAALAMAVLLNQKVRGLGLFRTVFYMPTIISGVAVALLWEWVLNPQFGLVNYLLSLVHLPTPLWFSGEHSVIPAFVMMATWGLGGQMIIFLAALQGVPVQMHEAAALDGATPWQRFLRITLPMISPAILFNLITTMIASFQVFTPAQVITQGGPNFASEFYVLYLFDNAFEYFKFGYAAAQAWILFLVILALTLGMLWASRRMVYYES